MSRTIRRQKRGAKAYIRSCRNNGTCPYCKDNRTYKNRKRMIKELIYSYGYISE